MKEKFSLERMLNWHSENHQKQLSGRYITAQMIAPLLDELSGFCTVIPLGFSVQNRPIHSIQIGNGNTRVLMWSQMHGNESTTTKAIFDLLLAFRETTFIEEFGNVLEELTICIIPILNPDGAQLYTRSNFNTVDLNRDAQALSQPESVILKNLFDQFKPDICFNLHGQRTIYGFEATGTPSVLSFLSPSADEGRGITLSRKRSMSIITSVFNTLKDKLPNQIGRYDDGFNMSCVGDTFQNKGVPTVLFEAGHAAGDYERELSRGYMFVSIVSALQAVVSPDNHSIADYLEIPEHQRCYCDILIKNSTKGDIRIQYSERLVGMKIHFVPVLADSKETKAIFGHRTIDAKGGDPNIIFDTKRDENFDIINILLDNGIAITL